MIFDKKPILACECVKEADKSGGISTSVLNYEGIDIVKTVISSKAAIKETGRDLGTYLTVCQGELYRGGEFLRDKLSRAVAYSLCEILKELEKKPRSFLFVGLGNREISADRIGVGISDKLPPIKESDKSPALFVISPGVLSFGGIEACDHIKGLIKIKELDAVIVADSLMTTHPERILATVQISNTGITPASGTKKKATASMPKMHAISEKTLGVPVISLGVPTVISFGGEKLYTPYTIDLEIEPICEIIADGISLALSSDH